MSAALALSCRPLTARRRTAQRCHLRHPAGKLSDNLVRDYQGSHYRYDASDNLAEKIDPEGNITRYQWNSLNQLLQVETGTTITKFAYDPLGRRIAKQSSPIIPRYRDAGSQYHRLEAERISREQNLGATFYGWKGDRLAWESTERVTRTSPRVDERSVIHHLVYVRAQPPNGGRRFAFAVASLRRNPLPPLYGLRLLNRRYHAPTTKNARCFYFVFH